MPVHLDRNGVMIHGRLAVHQHAIHQSSDPGVDQTLRKPIIQSADYQSTDPLLLPVNLANASVRPISANTSNTRFLAFDQLPWQFPGAYPARGPISYHTHRMLESDRFRAISRVFHEIDSGRVIKYAIRSDPCSVCRPARNSLEAIPPEAARSYPSSHCEEDVSTATKLSRLNGHHMNVLIWQAAVDFTVEWLGIGKLDLVFSMAGNT